MHPNLFVILSGDCRDYYFSCNLCRCSWSFWSAPVLRWTTWLFTTDCYWCQPSTKPTKIWQSWQPPSLPKLPIGGYSKFCSHSKHLSPLLKHCNFCASLLLVLHLQHSWARLALYLPVIWDYLFLSSLKSSNRVSTAIILESPMQSDNFSLPFSFVWLLHCNQQIRLPPDPLLRYVPISSTLDCKESLSVWSNLLSTFSTSSSFWRLCHLDCKPLFVSLCCLLYVPNFCMEITFSSAVRRCLLLREEVRARHALANLQIEGWILPAEILAVQLTFDDDSPPLSEARREDLHSVIASLLYLLTQTRPDILLPVVYLCSRVTGATEDDHHRKMIRVLSHLNATIDL